MYYLYSLHQQAIWASQTILLAAGKSGILIRSLFGYWPHKELVFETHAIPKWAMTTHVIHHPYPSAKVDERIQVKLTKTNLDQIPSILSK